MLNTKPSNLPHIEFIDFEGNGIFKECAIMKRDSLGNLVYIEVGLLDGIDKNRLVRILKNRNAANFELWDLMSQVTLNNGVNALTYFHQVARACTADGTRYNPHAGQIGASGIIDTRTPEQKKAQAEDEEAAPATKKRTTRKSA